MWKGPAVQPVEVHLKELVEGEGNIASSDSVASGSGSGCTGEFSFAISVSVSCSGGVDNGGCDVAGQAAISDGAGVEVSTDVVHIWSDEELDMELP